MSTIISIIVFVLLFGSIISIHELGHLVVAKFFGVYCPKYAIGFGPVLFHKQIGETDYELRAFPFGGFVMMAGDGDEIYEKDVPKDRLLTSKNTYQKICIFLAGVFFNFCTALIVMVIVFSNTQIVPTNSNKIGGFSTDSVLEKAGLEIGDRIESIYIKENNQTYLINSFDDIILNKDTIGDYNSIHITLSYKHDADTQNVECELSFNEYYQKYLLGITEELKKPSFLYACVYTYKEFIFLATFVIKSFTSLFTNFFVTVKEFSGPAGIYKETATITQSGDVSMLFYFWSLLCINIGVFNLFPIPGLDGYQVFVSIIERIIRKEISPLVKQYLTMIGFTFIILLMVIITIQDIIK